MRLLQDLGYERVAHYGGGIAEWQDAGLPMETGAGGVDTPERLPTRRAANRTVTAGKERGHSLIDLFERRTTGDLILLWFGTIAGCAALYWIISATSMGGLREGASAIGSGAHGLVTALYFSFVTATSVGFGDVVPLGVVRLIAIFEAIIGLLVFGAVVSKLVSRRQEQIVGEIHRIAFEDRLERVQTDLHLVLMELQAIAQLCRTPQADAQQIRARLDSASGMCLSQLRTIHDLLYRPQSLPEEALLEGILATLAMVLRELRELLRCISFDKSAYLSKNLDGVSRYAQDICSDCVPRRYAPDLRQWMDAIQQTAPDLS